MTTEDSLANQPNRERLINLTLVGLAALFWLILIGGQTNAAGQPMAAMAIPADNSDPGSSSLAVKRSPIAGVVDLYAGEQLVQNLVPVLSWQSAGRRFYNNAEIQSAAVALTDFDGGSLLDYAAFDRAERVDGAPPQPASDVDVSLLIRDEPRSVRVQPLIDANPHELTVEVGIGHFFGVYHGTNLIETSGVGPAHHIDPLDIPAGGGLMSLGNWRSYPGVQSATLHSSLAQQPALSLSLDGCAGRLDVEVRDRTWLPQLAIDRGLEPWIEAVILYAEPACYPLHLSLSAS